MPSFGSRFPCWEASFRQQLNGLVYGDPSATRLFVHPAVATQRGFSLGARLPEFVLRGYLMARSPLQAWLWWKDSSRALTQRKSIGRAPRVAGAEGPVETPNNQHRSENREQEHHQIFEDGLRFDILRLKAH